jgi:hypothetical protein
MPPRVSIFHAGGHMAAEMQPAVAYVQLSAVRQCALGRRMRRAVNK